MNQQFTNGYSRMTLDAMIERVRSQHARRAERLKSIKSRAAAEKYQDEIRRKIRRCFAPFPRKTDLNPRVTGVIREKSLTIEKVIFESRPGCMVSANLYLPSKRSERAPGVIGSCGHSKVGKAEPNYQAFCRELVAQGFVVLIFDPFNQGERDQYCNIAGASGIGSRPTHAHNMMGKQMELIGESFGSWRAWDGIRALDYLRSRPEVDPDRIGLTGNSGGGTMTSWIWGLDRRFAMAAPSCFVTTFLANLENEEPQDAEQYPHELLAAGLEMGDFFMVRAPDPVILIGQRYCFFDRRGLEETYEEVKRFYSFFNASEKVRHFLGENRHGYFPDGREAMVRFFCEHTGAKFQTPKGRPRILDAERLHATPKGEVVKEGSTPVFTLITRRADQLIADRPAMGKTQLLQTLRQLLHLPEQKKIPHYRVLQPRPCGNSIHARYGVETAPGIQALLRRPATEPQVFFSLEPEKKVLLYLPHLSAEAELISQRDLPNSLPMYGLDSRGLGESMPTPKEDFFSPYGYDYMMHGYELMWKSSFIGGRVHDVLSVLHLLQQSGAREIHLWGCGQGAILALFAGVLHPSIGRVVLQNGPLSCADWVKAPVVRWPAANFVKGMLQFFDLPDLFQILGDRLLLDRPWGPTFRPLPRASALRKLREVGLPETLLPKNRLRRL